MVFRIVASTALALGCLIGLSNVAAAQDAAAGEKVFAKCRPCHMIGETAKNSVGPVLNGIIGRKSGTYEGYNYSEANKNSGLTWDEATFRDYIHAPQAKVKGTKMVFAGLPNDKDVDNLIAFLKQYDASGKKTP
jgi:cytochrome c